MTLRELEDQALRLSAEDRWQLINTLVRSLQPKLQPTSKPVNPRNSNVLITLALGTSTGNFTIK